MLLEYAMFPFRFCGAPPKLPPVNATIPILDIAAALVALPGGRAAVTYRGKTRSINLEVARRLFAQGPVLVAHASLTARRLELEPPPRSPRLLDVLELFAFVRPAQFCAPSATGLALAVGLNDPLDLLSQAASLRLVVDLLLRELLETPVAARDLALAQSEAMGRAGWAWAAPVVAVLRSRPCVKPCRNDGLDVWVRLREWEDQAPPGEVSSKPIESVAASQRLEALLHQAGLSEARPAQSTYASEAVYAFQPREREGEPMMMLAEAGTGIGKTLGYLAPASIWAEVNGPGVWISTYTRALQRQIERESHAVYPDPAERAVKAVVRKGRENYLCLLNYQDVLNASRLGGNDFIGLALTGRWIEASHDGDMTGGDFPAWLPTLFDVSSQAQASPANLIDRRGECIHGGCPHYRSCFIEKAVRGSRRANLVIANHALVLSQAALDSARVARGRESDTETFKLRRIVFDEGHHLFDAADNAFAVVLSGAEAAEMRRWVRGSEGRGRRGRGLEVRLAEVLGDRDEARAVLDQAIMAAAVLPGEGWSGRVAPGAGDVSPSGALEAFFVAVLEQLRARAMPSEVGMECAVRPALDLVRRTAGIAANAITALEQPLLTLAGLLETILDEEADTLNASERARLEGALRALDRRARMQLPTWRSMLTAIGENADDPNFIDWFDATFLYGRVVDAACRRHWIDPTEPLTAAVIAPAHGVLVTSATLADANLIDPFALAEMRTGAVRLTTRPKTLRLASPFDYGANALALVVTDVRREDPRQIAAAMRELFLASGGGALGVFTAIRRLKAVHQQIARPLADRGISLLSQHVDPLEVGSLVDIFRAETESCLLGTDAVRDGIDVPGRSLRLLVFDRVPWPRPDILHKARRVRFGGKAYDDALAQARIAQAFGRLIRKADDKGVFVMLDAATPTRLFSGLPKDVRLQRVSLVEAIEATARHVGT